MKRLRLILNDGTVIEGGLAGYAAGNLWCYFAGTMQQAVSLFLDPAKTARIVFEYGEMQDVHEGFTTCTSVNIDVDGNVSVCLTGGLHNVQG